MYAKTRTIQRRLAWPLHKDDAQIRDPFQTFSPATNVELYFKVEWYPPYGPKSLFKFGEKRLIVCYCTHEQKMNFEGFTQNGCYGNQPQPFEVVFYSIDANSSCSFTKQDWTVKQAHRASFCFVL